MIISFSGIDSSGKSTQIALLKKYCESNNIKCKVVWSKARATPVVEFIKKLVRRDKKMNYTEKLEHREAVFANKKKKKLLLFASLVELCFYWGIYFRFFRWRNKCLILDRYLWDTYVEAKEDFYSVNFENWIVWRILKAVAVKPKHSFMFVVPVEVSLSRDIEKTDVHCEAPAVIDSIERKRRKIASYLELVDEGKWSNVINGTDSIDNIHRLILQTVGFHSENKHGS